MTAALDTRASDAAGYAVADSSWTVAPCRLHAYLRPVEACPVCETARALQAPHSARQRPSRGSLPDAALRVVTERPVHAAELARLLGCTDRGAGKALARLERAGKLTSSVVDGRRVYRRAKTEGTR